MARLAPASDAAGVSLKQRCSDSFDAPTVGRTIADGVVRRAAEPICAPDRAPFSSSKTNASPVFRRWPSPWIGTRAPLCGQAKSAI